MTSQPDPTTEERCRWWRGGHRWMTHDFTGIAVLIEHRQCSRCGERRNVQVTP